MGKKVINRLLACVLCAAMLITNQDMAYVFAMPGDGQEVYSDTGMEGTSGEAQDSEPEISDNVLEKPELPKTNELSDEDGAVLQSETVESVTLNTESLKLTVGEKFDLTVTVLPETMESHSVSWTSSDEKVATVAEGCVTAVEVGKCIVTASVGEKTAQCKVTVTDTIPAENVSISDFPSDLIKGQAYTLHAIVYPSNSTDKITWESSDESIATISDDGVLVAEEIGTCTITVSAGDKKYSRSYFVGESGNSGNIRWHISGDGVLSIEGTGDIETDTETGCCPAK